MGAGRPSFTCAKLNGRLLSRTAREACQYDWGTDPTDWNKVRSGPEGSPHPRPGERVPRVMGSPPRGGREGGGGAPLPLRSPLCWLPRGSPVAPPWLGGFWGLGWGTSVRLREGPMRIKLLCIAQARDPSIPGLCSLISSFLGDPSGSFTYRCAPLCCAMFRYCV